MPTKLTRQNLAEHATISLHVEPEQYVDVDGSGVGWIYNQHERGNVWAWCVVTVEATLGDGEAIGQAILGGCSYESRADFEKSNLAQMTSEALDDLWARIEAHTPAGRAKALALSSRRAITTSYRGPTDSRGSRVIARCEAKRISVPWDHALDPSANHAAAALQLMDQLGWSKRNGLVMGGTRDGYVFVQVPKSK